MDMLFVLKVHWTHFDLMILTKIKINTSASLFRPWWSRLSPRGLFIYLIIGNNNNNMGMNRLVWHFCAGRVPERGGGRSDDWVRGQPAPPGPVFAEAHGDAFTSGWGESLPAGHRSDPRRSVSSLRGLPQLQPIVFPFPSMFCTTFQPWTWKFHRLRVAEQSLIPFGRAIRKWTFMHFMFKMYIITLRWLLNILYEIDLVLQDILWHITMFSWTF